MNSDDSRHGFEQALSLRLREMTSGAATEIAPMPIIGSARHRNRYGRLVQAVAAASVLIAAATGYALLDRGEPRTSSLAAGAASRVVLFAEPCAAETEPCPADRLGRLHTGDGDAAVTELTAPPGSTGPYVQAADTSEGLVTLNTAYGLNGIGWARNYVVSGFAERDGTWALIIEGEPGRWEVLVRTADGLEQRIDSISGLAPGTPGIAADGTIYVTRTHLSAGEPKRTLVGVSSAGSADVKTVDDYWEVDGDAREPVTVSISGDDGHVAITDQTLDSDVNWAVVVELSTNAVTSIPGWRSVWAGGHMIAQRSERGSRTAIGTVGVDETVPDEITTVPGVVTVVD